VAASFVLFHGFQYYGSDFVCVLLCRWVEVSRTKGNADNLGNATFHLFGEVESASERAFVWWQLREGSGYNATDSGMLKSWAAPGGWNGTIQPAQSWYRGSLVFQGQGDYVVSNSYLPDPMFSRQESRVTVMAWFLFQYSFPANSTAPPTVVGIVPWGSPGIIGDTSYFSIVVQVRSML
jgi:hypothetical protein